MAEGPASPGGGSHESGDLSPRSSNVQEQDSRLPANGKIAKDAKETVQECVSEFISFITSEYVLIAVMYVVICSYVIYGFLILSVVLVIIDNMIMIFIPSIIKRKCKSFLIHVL